MSIGDSHSKYVDRGFDIVKECEVDPDFEDMVDIYSYWTTITITILEEPVRLALGGYYMAEIQYISSPEGSRNGVP